MLRFLPILLFLGLPFFTFSQNPHGEGLKMDCAACHSSEGWEISAGHWKEVESELVKPKISRTTGLPFPVDTSKFHHNKTGFELTGQHAVTDCRGCHETLVFGEANTECISCHTDMHQMTAGGDCARCHSTENWLVDDVQEIHFMNGFPLVGAHAVANCTDCHGGETSLQFGRIGNDCASCHLDEFMATTNPDHEAAGFSTNCIECHNIESPDWGTEVVDHSFFPLEKGHDIIDCAGCHTAGDFANTPSDCFACHQNDFENALSPNHVAADFQTDCAGCHTTDLGWVPAQFLAHDFEHFPIYSGPHEGTWDDCKTCHSNESDYAVFSCTVCHTNPETDVAHETVSGYAYENSACLACHPTGTVDGSFDHDATNFPLTGAHTGVDCIECHANGYAGTPTDCAACHQVDFDQSVNPNHPALGLPTDCAMCHTTEPDWMPATFAVHDDYYQLNGAHAAIANDCAACHNGDYVNTPNECIGCHLDDFNGVDDPDHQAAQFSTDCTGCHTESAWTPSTFSHDFYPLNGAHAAIANECAQCHIGGNYTTTPNECFGCHQTDFEGTTDPDHMAAGFSTDCAACHSEDAWGPATFDHDAQYFPIYSGAHDGEWGDCVDCHTTPGNYAEFTCVTCHMNPETDDQHTGVGGYVYESTACLACHPTGDADNVFDHNLTAFPLDGAHLMADCIDCHSAGYAGTPTDCAACHQVDFDQSVNPSHNALGLPTDCAMCHTTEPDWMPASFPVHDDYYQLNGAHAAIANDCAACHNGDYNNTPNTCFGCHQNDYNQTTAPDHQAAQFPTDCAECHTESDWTPSTFDHEAFYPFTGAHVAIADDCVACHVGGNYTSTPTECVGCHQTNFDQSVNPNHAALGLPMDCAQCHTTEPDWMPATFPVHDNYYQLNGAHATIANDCAACHNGDYNNTPNTCFGCHAGDYNATTDPNHAAAQFPTDCASCHDESAWSPSSFDHNSFYPLNGAHAAIENDCAACHTGGDFSNTPTDCFGCHAGDFNATTNPDHAAAQFPTDCTSCHDESAWTPANFDHDVFYPLTGAHQPIENECALCHIGGNFSNTPTDCAGCHQANFDQTTNPNHAALGLPTDCAQCHTTEPDWMPAAFPVHDDYYQLNGAHAAIANDCAACHNGDYTNTPNTCFGCHAGDYNATTDPNHATAGFPTDCESCHSEAAWAPASFDHSVFYPLTGAHTAIENDCALCHIGGDFSNTPNTCEGCHTPAFNGSVNPNHAALGLPTDCAMCHTTEPEWMPASFPVHDNYYQLNGAHAAIANDCAACHNGDYTNTPNTCFGCHADDYNATTDPNHATAGFPTDCQDCHNETAWTPSSWDHDTQYFPIYSGKHEGEWDECVDCHIGGNFSSFSCIDCHEHDDPVDMADKHQENGVPIPGYQYSSPACYSCHPTGEGD